MKEKVLEIVRQLEEDPNSLPRVSLPHDPSMPTGAPVVEEKVNRRPITSYAVKSKLFSILQEASTVSEVVQEPEDQETFKVRNSNCRDLLYLI